jgi:hypothetical protein
MTDHDAMRYYNQKYLLRKIKADDNKNHGIDGWNVYGNVVIIGLPKDKNRRLVNGTINR